MPEYTDKDYFDDADAITRVGGSEEILKMVIQEVLNSSEFDLLEQSLEGENYEDAEKYSHAIKGMVGNISMTRLYETSTQLNDELKVGLPNPASIEAYREALEKTFEVLKRRV